MVTLRSTAQENHDETDKQKGDDAFNEVQSQPDRIHGRRAIHALETEDEADLDEHLNANGIADTTGMSMEEKKNLMTVLMASKADYERETEMTNLTSKQSSLRANSTIDCTNDGAELRQRGIPLDVLCLSDDSDVSDNSVIPPSVENARTGIVKLQATTHDDETLSEVTKASCKHDNNQQKQQQQQQQDGCIRCPQGGNGQQLNSDVSVPEETQTRRRPTYTLRKRKVPIGKATIQNTESCPVPEGKRVHREERTTDEDESLGLDCDQKESVKNVIKQAEDGGKTGDQSLTNAEDVVEKTVSEEETDKSDTEDVMDAAAGKVHHHIPPLINKCALKRKCIDNQPFFAPNDSLRGRYAATIMQFIDDYKRHLVSAQRNVVTLVPWGLSVKVGCHWSRTIDVRSRTNRSPSPLDQSENELEQIAAVDDARTCGTQQNMPDETPVTKVSDSVSSGEDFMESVRTHASRRKLTLRKRVAPQLTVKPSVNQSQVDENSSNDDEVTKIMCRNSDNEVADLEKTSRQGSCMKTVLLSPHSMTQTDEATVNIAKKDDMSSPDANSSQEVDAAQLESDFIIEECPTDMAASKKQIARPVDRDSVSVKKRKLRRIKPEEASSDESDVSDYDFAIVAPSKRCVRRRVTRKPTAITAVSTVVDTASAVNTSAGNDEDNRITTGQLRVEEQPTDEETEKKVPCPICFCSFPVSQIQTHASSCQETISIGPTIRTESKLMEDPLIKRLPVETVQLLKQRPTSENEPPTKKSKSGGDLTEIKENTELADTPTCPICFRHLSQRMLSIHVERCLNESLQKMTEDRQTTVVEDSEHSTQYGNQVIQQSSTNTANSCHGNLTPTNGKQADSRSVQEKNLASDFHKQFQQAPPTKQRGNPSKRDVKAARKTANKRTKHTT